MKRLRLVALAVAACVLVIALVGYLNAAHGLPEEARAELDGYLAYRYLSSSVPSVLGTSQATRPAQFSAEMSSGTYGNSGHYRVIHNFRAIAAQQPRWPGSTETSKQLSLAYGAGMPLPYPPKEIWCVRLGSAEPAADVVLVAMHMDLYSADWVVHELPPAWSPAERRGKLTDLGCGGG